MKHILNRALAAFGALLLACSVQTVSAQDVDLEKYPDWKPFNPQMQKLMPQTKTRGAAKSINRGPRPDHINNALSMYFPPVFNQSGGSCGSAQAIGYMFTHEMNSWRNKDASFEENQYPSHFTWLFTSVDVPKIDQMVANGIPNVATYGGRTYSQLFGYQTPNDNPNFGWMQGYDKWYSAMFNRSSEFFYGPRLNMYEDDAREQLKQWLWNRWGTEGYNDGGVAGFGMASGGYWGDIPSTPTNDAIGVSRMKCVKAWGHTYDHGMTICGYDDRIEFDLDSNGVIGEKDKDEVGAWIICNSWGDIWNNRGFIYCPYKFSYARLSSTNKPELQWATELYVHRPDHKPMRTIKLTMDYSRRWELSLSAGISQDTSATKPDATTNFVHFTASTKYDKDGESPEIPMLGKWVDGVHSEPMEFGYDLTDLGERFDKSKPLKYFFFVNTRGDGKGEGHLYQASIMNYEYNREDPIEIPFKIDTIEVKGGEATLCVSVVVPGEAINPPLNANLNNNTLSWSAPQPTSLPITKYYIYNGNTLIDSTGVTKKSYNVSDPDGIYSVAAVYKHQALQLVSEKSNTATKPFIIEKGDNQILTLNNNSLIIPNAITSKLRQATIEFMFKTSSLAGAANKLGDPNGDFLINISASGQIVAGWNTSGATDYASTASGVIKANKWYHIAVVVDNNTITIYVDGMKKKSVTSSNYTGLGAIGDFVLGLDGSPMNGSIDEFRIWRCARSMTDIYAGKDDVISNPASLNDLIAYLPMELIEHDGEIKAREYALTNHGLFDNDKYTTSIDKTILNGSKLTTALSIACESDTVEAGTPIKVSAISPLSTIEWQWATPGAENKTYASQAPYITYNTAGTYNIDLTIKKEDGTTATASKEIVILPAQLPVVDFEISNPNKNAGEVFSFVNRSNGSGVSYVWTLSGAQQETLQATNATAIYDVPGTYTVTLTATNSSGSVSQSKTINVTAAPPTPAFGVSPSNILLGETTYLTDASRGAVDKWAWMLDNKTHLTVINGQNSSFTPKHPGIYDVQLTAYNEVGSKTLTKKKLLYVSNADAKNSLSFTGSERVNFTCPLTTNCKTWTFDWWMNPTQYTGAGGFYSENDFVKMYGIANGAYRIRLGNGTLTSSDGYVIINEWHHYAITYNSGKIVFYRDGKEWEAPTDKLSYVVGKWTGQMSINDAETPFKGLIDEVRVWNKALPLSDIQSHANAPIENPQDETNLMLYYNFNQGQGSVIDQTAYGHDGVRENFGPDGDAWPLVAGVFTLDLDQSSGTVQDVTSKYLTNYKTPFIYDESQQVSSFTADNFYALKQGTEDSGWILRGAYTNPDNGTVTGAHVDVKYGKNFTITTSYSGFNPTLENHRAYQTVVLPAGKYTFGYTSNSTIYADMASTMVIATLGSELSDNSNFSQSLAHKGIQEGKTIEFTLGAESVVSLGMLFNFGTYNRYLISEFTLTHQDVESLEADGETSIYESIDNGKAQEAYGRDGGIMIASREKKNFRIYTIDGQCVFNDEAQGVHFLPFDKGIYIVNGIKVAVK